VQVSRWLSAIAELLVTAHDAQRILVDASHNYDWHNEECEWVVADSDSVSRMMNTVTRTQQSDGSICGVLSSSSITLSPLPWVCSTAAVACLMPSTTGETASASLSSPNGHLVGHVTSTESSLTFNASIIHHSSITQRVHRDLSC